MNSTLNLQGPLPSSVAILTSPSTSINEAAVKEDSYPAQDATSMHTCTHTHANAHTQEHTHEKEGKKNFYSGKETKAECIHSSVH